MVVLARPRRSPGTRRWCSSRSSRSCSGSAETLFDNSAPVDPAERRRHATSLEVANGRLYAAEVVTNQFVGPPLGAFLFAATAAAPFFLDAGIVRASRRSSCSGSAARSVRCARRRRAARPTIRGRHRGRAPLAPPPPSSSRTLALALGVINMLDAATLAVLVLYALEVLGLSQTGYGLLLTAGGLGGLAGQLPGPRVSAKLGPGTFLILADPRVRRRDPGPRALGEPHRGRRVASSCSGRSASAGTS